MPISRTRSLVPDISAMMVSPSTTLSSVALASSDVSASAIVFSVGVFSVVDGVVSSSAPQELEVAAGQQRLRRKSRGQERRGQERSGRTSLSVCRNVKLRRPG